MQGVRTNETVVYALNYQTVHKQQRTCCCGRF